MSAGMLAAVLLPLAGVIPSQGAVKDAVEVTGRVEAGEAVPLPVGYRIELRSAGGVVAAAPVSLDGSFTLRAPPGEYTLSVLAFGVEVHRRPAMVPRACTWMTVRLPATGFSPPGQELAARS